jgi:XTP/dITP diphosphohydrolase
MRKLLIATANAGKIREIKAILKNVPFQIVGLEDVGYDQKIDETGTTFEENARAKAETIGKKLKMLTLAEDSGLMVDALGGKPGIYSARYGEGNDWDRVNKLLKELAGVPEEKRTARFKSVVAIFEPDTGKTSVFEGVTADGYITSEPRGNNGFGYDPIFYNPELGKTQAEATLEEKNKVSHRARALKKAKDTLRNLSS